MLLKNQTTPSGKGFWHYLLKFPFDTPKLTSKLCHLLQNAASQQRCVIETQMSLCHLVWLTEERPFAVLRSPIKCIFDCLAQPPAASDSSILTMAQTSAVVSLWDTSNLCGGLTAYWLLWVKILLSESWQRARLERSMFTLTCSLSVCVCVSLFLPLSFSVPLGAVLSLWFWLWSR